MDLVTLGPVDHEVHSQSPATEIVGLSDVNLDVLLEDMETISSPSSEVLMNGNAGSSTYQNYLWYSKKSVRRLQCNGKNLNSLKISKLSYRCNSDSDVDSTCGMVNIHNDTRFNLCENPSDMWFGLKMSDGTPVVISSRNRNFNKRPNRVRSQKYRDGRLPNSQPNKGTVGPIDYSSGFLSIARYVGRGSGASEIYVSTKHSAEVVESRISESNGQARNSQGDAGEYRKSVGETLVPKNGKSTGKTVLKSGRKGTGGRYFKRYNW